MLFNQYHFEQQRKRQQRIIKASVQRNSENHCDNDTAIVDKEIYLKSNPFMIKNNDQYGSYESTLGLFQYPIAKRTYKGR